MLKIPRKKAYTLFEMIIMVMIIWILIWIGIDRFSSINADRYYTESCVNEFYGPLSQWVSYASTSKILSWEIAPTAYFIQKEGVNSGFSLQYQINNGRPISYQTGLIEHIPYCWKGKVSRVQVNFSFDSIRMLPAFYPQGGVNGFEIFTGTDKTLATGAIQIKFCPPKPNTPCSEFWEILFDARTAMVKKRFCKLYFPKDASNPLRETQCRERSSGQ